MAKALACSIVLGLLAIGPLQARPFTAKDLALQERVSDPRISPDGRFVAYNVRSTDWEGNRGLNALWVMDRGVPNAVPRLIRDQEKGATQPRWSADGQWLYFLSARSGVKQLWRTSPNSPESQPITNLPLDVSFYRIKPDGRGFVLAVSVYPECETTPSRNRSPVVCSTTPSEHGIGILISMGISLVCFRCPSTPTTRRVTARM